MVCRKYSRRCVTIITPSRRLVEGFESKGVREHKFVNTKNRPKWYAENTLAGAKHLLPPPEGSQRGF